MQEPITIEQMKLSDRDRVLSFLAETYEDNPRQSDPEYWQWHFASDPDNIPVWLAKSGDRIAGQMACIPVSLKADDTVYETVWILDLMVDPEFRRMGIMKNLVRRLYEKYPIMLGVSTDQQHSPALLQSIGWKSLTHIPRYHKLLYPGNDLRDIQKYGWLVSAVNLLSMPLRPRYAIDHFGPQGHLRIVTDFNDDFERLWQQASEQWPCAVERTVETLNWQYKRQPGKAFDIIGYYRDDDLIGWAVLFFRSPDPNGRVSKGSITDICYHPESSEEIIDELLDGCLQMALDRGAGGLVTDVMDKTVEARLRQKGFWRIKSSLQLLVRSDDPHSLALDPDSWFLTRGDSDISIFEAPNI